MTATRPDRESGAPYEDPAYGGAGAFEAAVDRMDDPLNDPLPGSHPSPWFRPTGTEEPYEEPYEESYEEPASYEVPETYEAPASYEAPAEPVHSEPVHSEPVHSEPVHSEPVDDNETVGLRTADTRRAAGDGEAGSESGTTDASEGAADTPVPVPVGEGRAARRRAAQQAARRGGGGRRRRPTGAAGAAAAATPAAKPDGKPLSRVEARRAERAKRPSPAVVASRAVGEAFISVGVLMLLFVAYQLWWTNVRASQQAGHEASSLQESWASGKRAPGTFEPGQGFAIMHIPRLDVVVPVAEGIDKERVLDRGLVGHYGKGALKTAMPSAKQGNFAVAGHRNTHGEPFRYVNQLEKGDQIVVETQDKYYVYAMQSILPQTSPSNTGVLDPIPKGSGFTEPGRYITLTTCTPEFTSTYRMIVWGKMVEERPRSRGKPDALVR
ncbi:class E sortase [Streptomyces sp. B-S-A8]|uniref:Class E sortase n=1 Tax=Streptomyces solicavernae TaxID=3043614 RepID=A0ABT6RK47_9ACTN|nr:class E sortase [Streptomyces sp. B-S-A8]MDI3384799.1 class E sortase [Streptomyces sp. B-S-A8]